MQATAETGPPPRRQVPGSAASQQLRSGGDPSQNTCMLSGRSKKRERSELASDPVKQHLDKCCRSTIERDHVWKLDASSLVGKDGGLSSAASVDRLVYIMQHDCMQKPVDLTVSRTMLAKVVAATTELDCLTKFVKLGGLPLLDRWLQEVFRGKPPADNESSGDGEKACEDLLLALLGALERLPVDLVALKSCTVGKSVNNLRSHRHLDIQRRARKLVDMWKKRVDAEMKQSGEKNSRYPSVDQSLCSQQQDAEMVAVKAHKGSSFELGAQGEQLCMGRGKYASVVSLCSFPDSHIKVSSFAIPSSPSLCSVDNQTRAPSTAVFPAKSYNAGFNQTTDPGLQQPSATQAYTLSNEEGKVKSSVDFPRNDVSVSGSRFHMRLSKDAEAISHGKNTHKKVASVSSITVSGSVEGTKDHVEEGAVSCVRNPLHAASGSSAVEACTPPSCNSSPRSSDNLLNYVAARRTNLNAAYAEMDLARIRCGKNHNHLQTVGVYTLHPELANAGINLLANIAASENSMNDAKALESLSDKSSSVYRTTITQEKNVSPKICRIQRVNASDIMQTFLQEVVSREQFDRNSSTVSSPSETSTQLNILTGESRKARPVCVDAPSPADTTSETSLPSTFVSTDANSKSVSSTNISIDEHGKLQASGEEEKILFSELAAVAEAVGESSVVGSIERVERKEVTVAMAKYTQEIAALKLALKESTSPSRSSGDDPLQVARQVAMEVEQEIVNCHVDRTSAHSGGTVAANRPANTSVLEEGKKACSRQLLPMARAPVSSPNRDVKYVPCSADVAVTAVNERTPKAPGYEVAATKRRVETERLVFDLNERLSCEEGPVQDCTMSVAIPNGFGPVQDFTMSLPISSAKPTLASSFAGPTAPIAVVSVTKGPFTLPAISFRPTGELGWKGSAATSAFRPAQPRRSLEKSDINEPEHHPLAKPVLDFDLNVAADSIFDDDYKMRNADRALKPGLLDATVAGKQTSVLASVSSGLLGGASEPLTRPVWDLNRADEGGPHSDLESKVVQSRSSGLDFDLNNGPISQDKDEAALPGGLGGMWSSWTSGTNKIIGVGNGMLAHPINSLTPVTLPAFASSNSDMAYPLASADPWVNPGFRDCPFQYSIYMQGPGGFPSSGMAYPPLPPTAACSYGGFPFSFSPASIPGFSAPFLDMPHVPSLTDFSPPLPSTEALLPLHIKRPYMMGIVADAIQQGSGSIWGRPDLDLNSGPEVGDTNTKDERSQMPISAGLNDLRKLRHQVVDVASVLKHREEEGC